MLSLSVTEKQSAGHSDMTQMCSVATKLMKSGAHLICKELTFGVPSMMLEAWFQLWKITGEKDLEVPGHVIFFLEII